MDRYQCLKVFYSDRMMPPIMWASQGASDNMGGIMGVSDTPYDAPMMGGITYHCKTPLNIDIYPWWVVWWGGGGQVGDSGVWGGGVGVVLGVVV